MRKRLSLTTLLFLIYNASFHFSFMHDNLGMSHEDVQRTLQANMPPPDSPHHPHNQQKMAAQQQHHPAAAAAAAAAAAMQQQQQQQQQHQGGGVHPALMPQHPVDLNPMDFIEHDVVNPAAATGGGPA